MVDNKSQKDKEKKAFFKVLAKTEPLVLGGVTYFVSIQEIKQEDSGNVSNHLVVKKQSMSEDGSPRGQSRQLFIPQADASKVLKYANDFLIKQKG